jgi:hypothetical protein
MKTKIVNLYNGKGEKMLKELKRLKGLKGLSV